MIDGSLFYLWLDHLVVPLPALDLEHPLTDLRVTLLRGFLSEVFFDEELCIQSSRSVVIGEKLGCGLENEERRCGSCEGTAWTNQVTNMLP
jgi:hypothetical protein